MPAYLFFRKALLYFFGRKNRNEAVKISYTKLWITQLIKKVLTAITVEISRKIKKVFIHRICWIKSYTIKTAFVDKS